MDMESKETTFIKGKDINASNLSSGASAVIVKRQMAERSKIIIIDKLQMKQYKGGKEEQNLNEDNRRNMHRDHRDRSIIIPASLYQKLKLKGTIGAGGTRKAGTNGEG